MASRILIVAVMVISSFLFAYVTTNDLNVHEMGTPITGTFMRWDSEHYLAIAKTGYPLGYPNATTFPSMTGTGSPMPFKDSEPPVGILPPVPSGYGVTGTDVCTLSQPNLSQLNSFIDAFRGNHKQHILLCKRILFLQANPETLQSTISPNRNSVLLLLGRWRILLTHMHQKHFSWLWHWAHSTTLKKTSFPRRFSWVSWPAFTRSDGFLIFIPFFIYGLLQLRTQKQESVKLFLSSAVVASPYLVFNVAGYFLAGGVFPVQIIARESNWGVYPLLINQFSAPYCPTLNFQAFDILGLGLALLPTAYFALRTRKVFAEEAKTLGYWVFYASMVLILFTRLRCLKYSTLCCAHVTYLLGFSQGLHEKPT